MLNVLILHKIIIDTDMNENEYKIRCQGCDEMTKESEMANEFFCHDCNSQTETCPECGNDYMIADKDGYTCVCGYQVGDLFFSGYQPQIYNGEIECRCTCGGLMQYDRLEVHNECIFTIFKCTKCRKESNFEVEFKH